MSSRVLVTGANGFVGRRVCGELNHRGYAVRAAVRSEDRGGGLAGEIVAVGDLGPGTDWTRAVTDVDAVIHLAARVHVMNETAADPLAAFCAVNVGATESLARAAADGGVRRLVYVSSIKVNGEATGDTPFGPGDPPHPNDPYGVSKWKAEELLWCIAANSGLEVTVVRPPLVYGPGVAGNFIRLLKLVARGTPLPLGAVENRRSMIYSGNLADALIACATHPCAAGKTYLVSDGDDVSTPRLLLELAGILRKRPRLWHVPPALLRLAGKITGKSEEVDRLVGSLRVDASGMTTDLHWQPPFSVAEGLTDTVEWFIGLDPGERGI